MAKAYRLLEPFNKLDLRFKVAMVFVLPLLALVLYLSYKQYSDESKFVEEQTHITAMELGDIVLSGLTHSMMINDRAMISSALRDIGTQGNIDRVWIINQAGEVREANRPSEVGQKFSVTMVGCVECHQVPVESRPGVLTMKGSSGQLRVAIPIVNKPDCQACHPPSQKKLGMLFIDTSITVIQKNLKDALRENLLWSFTVAIFAIMIGLILVNWLVVRRVEVLHHAFNTFEKGDLSARVDPIWHTEDEISKLALSFNRMADSLVRHENEQRSLAETRQQAIIEERERIARELHDGVAQFIGYVNTKIMAVRLLIKQDKLDDADLQLEQVEQAVHEQSNDVRASIIGLKMASEGGQGLDADLQEFIVQCNRLSDFPIELVIGPDAKNVKLDVEVELQLLRIVQEAMSNVRKHASAGLVLVSLLRQADDLILSIHDDGVGFNPWQWNGEPYAHFGLQTMQERAEMIGADLHVESEPGQGTMVTVRLKVEDS